VTVNALLSASPFKMELKNPENEGKRGYKNSGHLILTSASITQVDPREIEEKRFGHTFLDYIKGGCTINMMVAIDFTASNEDAIHKHSKHYRLGETPNHYQQAIDVIGNILAPYDSDNMIPVFGFGAGIGDEFTYTANHCFALNFDEQHPEVKGVDGILKVYDENMPKLNFSGPTNFAEFIGRCRTLADTPPVTQKKQHYNIVLVLTDGEVTDMKETQAEIEKASQSPLSIIIIGIGDADFKKMEKLDGDDVKASKAVCSFIFQITQLTYFLFWFRGETLFSSFHSTSTRISMSLCWQRRC
jgi:hypothetical protein